METQFRNKLEIERERERERDHVVILGKLSHGGTFTAGDDEASHILQLLWLPYFDPFHSYPSQRYTQNSSKERRRNQFIHSFHVQRIWSFRKREGERERTCNVFVERALKSKHPDSHVGVPGR